MSSPPSPPTTEPLRGDEKTARDDGENAPLLPGLPSSTVTDIKELLPISEVTKSLPLPPQLLQVEPAPTPGARRIPWTSLAVFTVMLGASAATLTRYPGQPLSVAPEARTAALIAAPPLPAGPRADDSDAVSRLERAHGESEEARGAALLEAGDRALEQARYELAEAFFARAHALDPSEAGAVFKLARARLAQHDLEGAEDALRAAIARDPHNTAYHGLYAELLTRLGRTEQAARERELAR